MMVVLLSTERDLLSFLVNFSAGSDVDYLLVLQRESQRIIIFLQIIVYSPELKQDSG